MSLLSDVAKKRFFPHNASLVTRGEDHRRRRLSADALLLRSYTTLAQSQASHDKDDGERKLTEARVAQHLMGNLDIADAHPGVVLASPSQVPHNYRYHWARDAALVYRVISKIAAQDRSLEGRAKFWRRINAYRDLTHFNQSEPSPHGFGVARAHPDGRHDHENFSPQNDGPALRAVTHIGMARWALRNGHADAVVANFYGPTPSRDQVIRNDLDYTAREWRNPSVELWEMDLGFPFYTRVVQYDALMSGAAFAVRMGDGDAAERYREQAVDLAAAIERHWDEKTQRFFAMLELRQGLSYKYQDYGGSGLDIATILAVLHSGRKTGLFGCSDDRILSTAFQLQEAFRQLYFINQNPDYPGVAIGRYPEDRYPFLTPESNSGHPWFLATNAFAEFYSRVAEEFYQKGEIIITPNNVEFFADLLRRNGDDASLLTIGHKFVRGEREFLHLITLLIDASDGFFDRVEYHATGSAHAAGAGHLYEQYSRNTGLGLSVEDLTWSYSSYLTALWTRRRLRILKPFLW